MNIIALQTVVDLNVIFTIVGILVVATIGVLLAILLVRVIGTVGKINQLLTNKKEDIEKTIANLPVLTKNISDVTGEVTKTVATVNEVADSVKGAVNSFTAKKAAAKGPSFFSSVTKVFEIVKKRKAEKKKDA